MKELNATALTEAHWFINVATLWAVESSTFLFSFPAGNMILLLEDDSYRVQRGKKNELSEFLKEFDAGE